MLFQLFAAAVTALGDQPVAQKRKRQNGWSICAPPIDGPPGGVYPPNYTARLKGATRTRSELVYQKSVSFAFALSIRGPDLGPAIDRP